MDFMLVQAIVHWNIYVQHKCTRMEDEEDVKCSTQFSSVLAEYYVWVFKP